MTSVRDNLIAARALIENPTHWMRHSIRNREGTCFCAMGAVSKIARGDAMFVSSTPEFKALTASLPGGFKSVPTFNDHIGTTHLDVMALFDRAIAAQEPRP